MELKKKTFEFTSAMILFYFLSTSILNWFSGLAFYDLGFYLFIMVLCLLSLYWVIKIILSPHYVKNKDTNAPTVLFVIGIVLTVLLIPTSISMEDFLEDIYFFCIFLSMAGLIKWYKNTGIELSQKKTEKVEKPVERIIIEPSDMEQLRSSIKEALYITPIDTDAYNHLIHSDTLIEGLIEEKIEGPGNIVKQMNAVINHYTNLVKKRIKTKKIVDTLIKLEGTLKMVEDTLTQIYDIGIDNQLNNIEMDSETLESLIELSGLKGSDFKLDD